MYSDNSQREAYQASYLSTLKRLKIDKEKSPCLTPMDAFHYTNVDEMLLGVETISCLVIPLGMVITRPRQHASCYYEDMCYPHSGRETRQPPMPYFLADMVVMSYRQT